ncbi:MAG: helix-turn-helix domain-containing protein [Candidatus Paceibacteria bacterium]
MTNVSKQQLTAEVGDKLRLQLARIFDNVPLQKSKNLFEALLSESEQIMLAKRLAVILLVHQKVSVSEIAKRVLVSDATVRALRAQYKEGRYMPLISHCTSSSFDSHKFWQTLEVVLRGGLPSRGKDRWRWVQSRP